MIPFRRTPLTVLFTLLVLFIARIVRRFLADSRRVV